MPASQLFLHLQQRIADLALRMLPVVRDDLTYTEEEYDRVRAFIVLTHAEVESFIEHRVLGELNLRMRAWKEHKRPSGVLMGLLAFSGQSWPGPIEDLSAPTIGDRAPSWALRDLQRRLDAAITCANARIRVANHGVRSKDALAMLLPLGFDVSMVDPDLIRELDDFGSQRGQIAHTSARTVKSQPDPAAFRTKANGLLKRLGQLDLAISSLP